MSEITERESIRDVADLEDLMATPDAGLIEDFDRLEGDILVLGCSGKVGPTLCRMAKRAVPGKRVMGVARFSDPDIRARMESWGIECLPCDLLDRKAVASLPDVPNIVYMAGRKFGTIGDEPHTWAMNALVPAIVGDRFRQSRIVGFSTLCVYPYADVTTAGCTEDTPPVTIGEYANSCVGRERMFQYMSLTHGNSGRITRLNYAIDLRYGVLHDIARWVLTKQPIDLRTSQVNVIWQGDAISQILRCLLHCETPSAPINIGAPEHADVRQVAIRFGQIFHIEPVFVNEPAPTCWINDTSLATRLFGRPQVDLDTMIRWNADWLNRRMPVYQKPTHYEEREGAF